MIARMALGICALQTYLNAPRTKEASKHMKTHMTLKAGTPVRAISPTVRSLLFPKCL